MPTKTKETLIGDDATIEVEAAPTPSDRDLGRVAELAREQFALIKKKVELEDELADINDKLMRNTTVDLPAKLAELGLTRFGLKGGFEVVQKEIINGSIKEELRPAAHAWLEGHGHGGLIKRKIEVFFSRGDLAWAKKFMADCARRKKPLDLKSKEWVEPQTLGAFVREQIRKAESQGADPNEYAPADLLGVFRQTVALIDGPDMPRSRRVKKGKGK